MVDKLDGLYGILVNFEDSSLAGFYEKRNLIASKQYVMIRNSNLYSRSTLSYKVYARTTLEKFLTKTPYTVFNSIKGIRCRFKTDKLCWKL